MDSATSIAGLVVPGGVLLRRRPLTGGVSAAVEALTIGSPGGGERTVVVRRPGGGFREATPDQAAREHALLQALYAAGLPVPEPLYLDPSGSFLVMDYVGGGEAPAEPWTPMADFLVRLHAISPSTLALPALPRGEDPIAGALALPVEGAVRDALDRVAPTAEPERLLHGDFWVANVVWRDGEIAAVVDWEGAALGDPHADVACGRIELAVSHGALAADAFVARYAERATVDPIRLAVWEVHAAGSALASMAAWGLPPEVEARRRAATERAHRAACERLLGHSPTARSA